MSDKSINSLFGMLSTKELPASGIQKTTNNSIQGNHENSSFHARLTNSMKSPTTLDGQSYTPVPSELNNITDTDDINHIIELLSMGVQSSLTADTDDNQLPLNQEVNQNIPGKEFTNAIINNSSNVKPAPVQIESNTLLESALPINQELKSLSEPNTNRLKITQQTIAPFSEKLNGNQGMINITQSLTGELSTEQPATSSPEKSSSANLAKELTKDSLTEQTSTSLLDKLSTNQNNAKINEQKIVSIQNSANLTRVVANDTDNEPVSQPPKIPGRQILESDKESSANALNVRLNSNKDLGQIQPTAPAGSISNTKHNTVNNASSDNSLSPLEKAITNTNDNIQDHIKAQLTEKGSLAKTSINQPEQQGSAQINADNNESPIIVKTNINTEEAKVAKSFENTTINNNGTNIVEAAIPVNTSSDNSFSNNQGADTPYEFQVNAVNIKQNTEQVKNFTNTLSQISGSNKPLGPLGNDVADNIIQNAKLYTQGGKSEIKIHLNPPELGTLKLEFAFEKDVLETKIIVERSSVKDVIEKDIPRLRELIANSDIDVGKLDVSLQEKENGRQNFMNKDFHSDSKSKSTQDFSNQDNEYYENNADEETMVNNTESTQINYLV